MNDYWRNFLRGAGSTMDLFGVGYRPEIDRRPVADVLADDWRTVQGDAMRALARLAEGDPEFAAALEQIASRRETLERRTPRRHHA